MIRSQYISSLLAVMMGIFFIPDMESAIRVYLISVVVFVSTIVNLLFRIEMLRRWVVQKIVADVMAELFKNDDVKRLLSKQISNEHHS